MQTDKKEVKKVIHIEVCQDCKIHEWCTHHDEKKYLNNFENVKSAILSTVPGCEVVKNVDMVPKIGAFEVTHEGQGLFSKIKSGLWPNPTAFAQRVKAYFDDLAAGKDVSNYGKTTEKPYARPKKKIDPHSSRYKAFLSTSGSQTTLPKTEKNSEPEASKNEKGEEEAGSPGYHPDEDGDSEAIESPTKNPPVKQENEVKAKPSEDKPKPKEEEQKVEKPNQTNSEEHQNEQNDVKDQHEPKENKDEESPKKENEEDAEQVEEDA